MAKERPWLHRWEKCEQFFFMILFFIYKHDNMFWLPFLGDQKSTGAWDQGSRLWKECKHQTSCIKDEEDGNKPAPEWKRINCTWEESWCQADRSRWTDGISQWNVFSFCGRIKIKNYPCCRSTEAEYESSKTEKQIKTDVFSTINTFLIQ